MRRLLAATLGVAALAAPASAQELPRLGDLGLKGAASFTSLGYFAETPNDDQTSVNLGLVQLEWARRFGAWGAVRVAVDGRHDDFGYARGVSLRIPDTDPRRSYVSVREATFALRQGPVEVTVGKQIFAWGTADAFNPTDTLNPYDYLEPLDAEKMGIWSAAARLGTSRLSLVLAVVPGFTPSRLPLERSRWTPTVPSSFVAIVDDPVLPEQDAGATQYAARLKGTVGGWDVSVSYYDGFEHTPVFRESTATVAPGVVLPRYTPVYTRERVPGADFSTTIGRFEVHGEMAFRLVESNGRDDIFQAITGFNYTHDVGLRWLDQLTLVLEYAHETILRHHRHSGIADSDRIPLVGGRLATRAFQDAIVGRIQAKLTEDTVLELSGIADLEHRPSHYIQLKGAHRVTDALHVEAGLDFLTGKSDTFWGRWGDNDRVFIVLRYLF